MTPKNKVFPPAPVPRAIAAAALVSAALGALPATAQQTPWYLGLSIGESKTDSALVTNRESNITYAYNFSTAFDSKDTAWRALLGYRFHQNLAVEAGYADYGRTRMITTFNVQVGATGAGAILTDRDVKGFGADLALTWPVMDDFALLARLGYFRAESKATATLSGDVVFSDGTPGTTRTNTNRENLAKFGLGVEWLFAKNAGMRLEWERLPKVGTPLEGGASGRTGEADVDAYTIGVVWRF